MADARSCSRLFEPALSLERTPEQRRAFKVAYLLTFWVGSSALYCAALYHAIDDRFYDYWWDASFMTAARVFVAVFGATYLAWTFALALLAARRMGGKPMGDHIIFLCHIWRIAIVGVGISAGSAYASVMESDRIACFFQYLFTFSVFEVVYLFRPVLLPASARHDLELQPHNREARPSGHAEFTQLSPRHARDLQQPAVNKDGTLSPLSYCYRLVCLVVLGLHTRSAVSASMVAATGMVNAADGDQSPPPHDDVRASCWLQNV
jgi:hypothetical protein